MNNGIIKKYYEKQGAQYGINSLRRKKMLGLILEEGVEKKRILDIGCATGYVGKELKRENNILAGVDISEANLAEAKKYYDETCLMDVESDGWPQNLLQNPFDIVIAGEITEHLFDQDGFLQKVKKVMKPEGRFILTTPNFLLWNNRIRILLGQYGMKEMYNDKSHIHLLSYRGFQEKIRNAGYRNVREDNIWYPNYLEKIHRILPPNLFVFQTIIKLEKIR